jgi:hypothetical protein
MIAVWLANRAERRFLNQNDDQGVEADGQSLAPMGGGLRPSKPESAVC